MRREHRFACIVNGYSLSIKIIRLRAGVTRLRLRRTGVGAGAWNSRRPRHDCAIAARPAGCSNRYFPYRGIRLPFDSVHPLEVNEFNSRTVERAVAEFEPS